MSRKPRRPVLDPVAPDTPTLAELAHARSLAARYQNTRAIPLNTPVLGPLNIGRIARHAFPANAWQRAATRRRMLMSRQEREAARAIGRMAFALRDLSLRYALTRRPKPTLPPAA
jgi:hypothetical protein